MKTKLFYKIFAFTFGMMLLITVLAHVLIFMIAPSENVLITSTTVTNEDVLAFSEVDMPAAHNADNPKVISAFICLLHGNFAGFFVFVLQRNNGPDIVYLNVCPSNVKVGSYRRDHRDLHRRNRRIS